MEVSDPYSARVIGRNYHGMDCAADRRKSGFRSVTADQFRQSINPGECPPPNTVESPGKTVLIILVQRSMELLR